MNLSFKADSGKVFEVPFTYEQLNYDENSSPESIYTIKFFKLILKTMLTDLPFQQIIYTLPYLDDFIKLMKNCDGLITHKLEITFGVPKLFVHTFDGDLLIETTTFDIMTNQFFLCSTEEERLATLQKHFKEIFIAKETYLVPNLILYRETKKAFEKCTIVK